MLIVSKPVKVMVEIEDLHTGCEFGYKGNNVKDCIDFFQSLFLVQHAYKITRQEDVKEDK